MKKRFKTNVFFFFLPHPELTPIEFGGFGNLCQQQIWKLWKAVFPSFSSSSSFYTHYWPVTAIWIGKNFCLILVSANDASVGKLIFPFCTFLFYKFESDFSDRKKMKRVWTLSNLLFLIENPEDRIIDFIRLIIQSLFADLFSVLRQNFLFIVKLKSLKCLLTPLLQKTILFSFNHSKILTFSC